MGSPPAVCVNDDFATGEAGVTLWTADDEEARWLNLLNVSNSLGKNLKTYMVDGLFVQVLCRNDLLDNLLLDLLSDLQCGNIVTVLSTHNNGIYA